MKIVVFGATGGTGREVVKQALAQGHNVTAFVRDSKRLRMEDERLRVVVGDALQPEPVAQAVRGQDAVVVALGSRNRSERSVRSAGTANVIQAMEEAGVARLVVVSAGGVGDSYDQAPLVLKLVIKTLLRNTYADHEEQERHVRESSLEWVIVRPARLVEGPASGEYHVAAAESRPPGGQVTTADLAAFLLQQLSDDHYLHQAISIG